MHTSFKWVGQDGSQVATHMTPVNTYVPSFPSPPPSLVRRADASTLLDSYTAQASVDDVRNSINNHKSLQSGAATGLLAFGNGDGGGGPLAPMLENLRRCRAVAEQSPGELPKVTMGQSVEMFFEDILSKTEGGKTLPTWNGGEFWSHLDEVEISALTSALNLAHGRALPRTPPRYSHLARIHQEG